MKINWRFWEPNWPWGVPEVEEPKPIVLQIPEDRIQEILRLRDAYGALPSQQDQEAFYLLWKAIAEIYPCVRVGRWRLNRTSALKLEVIQTEKE
jgi:hypothetical protein